MSQGGGNPGERLSNSFPDSLGVSNPPLAFSGSSETGVGDQVETALKPTPAVEGRVAALGYLLNLCLGLRVLKCESDG